MKFHTTFFRHDDAVALGSSDLAIILEFIRWSCHYKESGEKDEYMTKKYFVDGVWWMQDSIEAWQLRMPWVCKRTIASYLEKLVKLGRLAKRCAGDSNGGRIPNFYRTIDQEVECKFCTQGLNANSALVECKSCMGLNANFASASLSNNRSKNLTNKSAKNSKTWPQDDPMAALFENLVKIAACRRSFDREKYRGWVNQLTVEQAVDINKLKELSHEWQKHHNLPGARKVANPLASFKTWVKNHFEWGKDNGNGGKNIGNIRQSAEPDYSEEAFIKAR